MAVKRCSLPKSCALNSPDLQPCTLKPSVLDSTNSVAFDIFWDVPVSKAEVKDILSGAICKRREWEARPV